MLTDFDAIKEIENLKISTENIEAEMEKMKSRRLGSTDLMKIEEGDESSSTQQLQSQRLEQSNSQRTVPSVLKSESLHQNMDSIPENKEDFFDPEEEEVENNSDFGDQNYIDFADQGAKNIMYQISDAIPEDLEGENSSLNELTEYLNP